MGCEDFRTCGVPQPGYRVDHAEQAAHAIARELFSPDPRMRAHGIQDIRDEVYNMRPREAERFTAILNRDMQGRSPLREVPEVVRDRYGNPCPTGNDVLVLNDPYDGRREVLKQIRHDNDYGYDVPPQRPIWDERPPVVIQQPPVIIDQGPIYRPRGGDLGERIIDRAIDGFGLGIGLGAADRLFNGGRHHR
ncbi:MAG: hypothetical protein JSS83_20405 [Cyanobacteria bacterium SZAS LIN-3]|nr:hypothetical protein [Cyanobacteria bacterium SZAS LIN-3]